MIKSYKELIVWQKGMMLVVEVYRLTASFPKSELYGLTNQMRRAVVSIPANIAEGFTRKHRLEYAQFVRIAFGSGAELETHIAIAKALEYATEVECRKIEELLSEVMKMLNKMADTLKNH